MSTASLIGDSGATAPRDPAATGGLQLHSASGGLLESVEGVFTNLAGKRADEITVADMVAAGHALAPLYDILFPPNSFVSNTLKGDLNTKVEEVRGTKDPARDVDATAACPVTKLIDGEVSALTVANRKIRSGLSVTHGTLWMCRTVAFISQFMLLLSKDSNASPAALAREAYASTLKPYHGMLLGGIVRAALSFVPSRDVLKDRFGYADESAARAQLTRTQRVVHPLADTLMEWMRGKGLDFPDKA